MHVTASVYSEIKINNSQQFKVQQFNSTSTSTVSCNSDSNKETVRSFLQLHRFTVIHMSLSKDTMSARGMGWHVHAAWAMGWIDEGLWNTNVNTTNSNSNHYFFLHTWPPVQCRVHSSATQLHTWVTWVLFTVYSPGFREGFERHFTKHCTAHCIA